MEEYGKIRLYNARNDMLDMTNPDMFGADQEGLGVQFESEFRTADSHFSVEKSELQRKTLSLNLWLGDRTGQSYQRFSDLVAFLNHTPYRIEYETPTGIWSRDCILNELTKSLIKEESILVEELQLDFTTPFYIERSERTTDNPPIEGKAGKIYETVTRKRQVFEGVPESYREGDLWHWQGEDFPGRNLFKISDDDVVIEVADTTAVDYMPPYNTTQVTYNISLLGKISQKEFFKYSNISAGDNLTVSGKIEIFRLDDLPVKKEDFNPGGDTLIFSLYRIGGSGSTWGKFASLGKDEFDKSNDFIFDLSSTRIITEGDTLGNWGVDSPGMHMNRFPGGYGVRVLKDTFIAEKGSNRSTYSKAPEGLTGGKTSGYFIATKSSNSFNFNDFVYYGQSANENTYYDKIYDYTYSYDDYPTETEESYYAYDYVYADEDEGKNVFQVDNHSVYIGSSKHSPCEITIYGPCENPHWQVTQGSKILQSDGFNLTALEGHRLVVSSNPQSQRAVLIALDGTVSNVYQQQDLSKSNFVTFPVGRSKILFFNCDKVSFSYREERVTV